MEEQEKEVMLRVPDPGDIIREIIRSMETELKYFRLPVGEYPDYVDIFVRYPEVLAKIRIEVKVQEEIE